MGWKMSKWILWKTDIKISFDANSYENVIDITKTEILFTQLLRSGRIWHKVSF